MSAPIGSSTTRSASARSASVAAQMRLVGGQSGVASAALGQADGSRPQVQSRRVSLKLGPLGITYSTDQVLWPEAAATAGAGAAVADASPSPGLDPDAEPVDAVSGLPGSGQNAGQASRSNQAEQAQQADAAAAGRSFHLELAQAWRRQLEERAAATETYGPDGAARSGASSAAATTAATSAEAGSSAPAATAAATGAASSAGASAATPSAENTTAPPAARMRRAIGAYLACARDFSSAQPMLTAVA